MNGLKKCAIWFFSLLLLLPLGLVSAYASDGAQSNYTAISSDGETTAAITANGDLYCWGDNTYGTVGIGPSVRYQETPVKVLSDVRSILIRSGTAYAILKNGDLYAWGKGNYGCAGTGSEADQFLPVKILSNVKQLIAELGSATPGAITTNNDLYCWGQNAYGCAGAGHTNYQLTPVKVLSNVSYATITGIRSAAITQNGDLYCWGSKGAGLAKCPEGTYQVNAPVKVYSGVASVTLHGTDFGLLLTYNGDLCVWGDNRNALLGVPLGDYDTSSLAGSWVSANAALRSGTAPQIAAASQSAVLSAGSTVAVAVPRVNEKLSVPTKVLSNVDRATYLNGNDTLPTIVALTKNSDLYCWGYNGGFGTIGNGTKQDQTTPYKALSNVKNFTVGGYGVYAITNNGDLFSWGRQAYYGWADETEDILLAPKKLLSNISSFSLEPNGEVAMALTSGGDLYSWGNNNCGGTGNGIDGDAQVEPVKVLSDVVYASALSEHGGHHTVSMAITSTGDLYCWGKNNSGQVGNGGKGIIRHTKGVPGAWGILSQTLKCVLSPDQVLTNMRLPDLSVLVQATSNADLHITYNGVEQVFTNTNGGSVLPLTYQGTTYLPVRAVAGLVGLHADWDANTQTVLLTTASGSVARYSSPGSPLGATTSVTASLNRGVKVTLNGDVQTFYDANGQTVYPIVYNGTTYLPVRAISSLVNLSIQWDGAANTVRLTDQ